MKSKCKAANYRVRQLRCQLDAWPYSASAGQSNRVSANQVSSSGKCKFQCQEKTANPPLSLCSSPFLFGYAKPVSINFRALRCPRRDMMSVLAAGSAWCHGEQICQFPCPVDFSSTRIRNLRMIAATQRSVSAGVQPKSRAA